MVPSLFRDTSLAGAAEYTAAERFFWLLRTRCFDFAEAIAARRTERFTDHATIPRQARTASPIKPRMAPTAIKTVPSGVFDVCRYGAPAVGGTVTIAAAVELDVDDVDAVVVETDDVVVLLSEVVEEVDVDESEVVLVVESMVVDVVDDSEVVLVVLSDVDVEEVDSVVDAVVSVTLGVLSVVERSSVVWASVVASVVLSPAGSADTPAAMTTKMIKRSRKVGWDFPSRPDRTRILTVWFSKQSS